MPRPNLGQCLLVPLSSRTLAIMNMNWGADLRLVIKSLLRLLQAADAAVAVG